MGKKHGIVVEIFDNEKFVGWFPESSFAQSLKRINAYEGGKPIGDFHCSYLIFQEGGGKYHRFVGDKGYSFVGGINLKEKIASHEFII